MGRFDAPHTQYARTRAAIDVEGAWSACVGERATCARACPNGRETAEPGPGSGGENGQTVDAVRRRLYGQARLYTLLQQ